MKAFLAVSENHIQIKNIFATEKNIINHLVEISSRENSLVISSAIGAAIPIDASSMTLARPIK